MKRITIDTEIPLYTSVSNHFIDYYMSKANGDFVKVYLYLLRCLNNPQITVTSSSIADALLLTEADVIRALKYWQEAELLNISIIENSIEHIHILSPKGLESKNTTTTLEASPSKQPVLFSTKPEYNPSELKKLSENDSIKQLIYVTQKYLGKMLTQNELSTLVSFNDWLGLPFDVIEYLIEYCVSNNHKSMRYIEKVALSWAENNLDTIEKVEHYTQVFNKHYFAIMKSLGIGNRNPAISEIKYMKKWIEHYKFEIDLILEACNRTIQAIHQPSFEYADSILAAWLKQKVRNLEDIKQLDLIHNSKKQKTATSPKPEQKFANYDQRTYDFEELERKARERLIKQSQ